METWVINNEVGDGSKIFKFLVKLVKRLDMLLKMDLVSKM